MNWIAYQEYTSDAGGKIFFPLSCSFFRKRFSSRKSLLTTSSLSCASQLSSSDWISKARRSFCSGVSFSIHFSLSNFRAEAAAADGAPASLVLNMDAVVVAVVVTEAVDFWELPSMALVGEDETVETVSTSAVAGLDGPAGEEKNEVIDALAFGFLAVDVAMSAALRLRGVAMADLELKAKAQAQAQV